MYRCDLFAIILPAIEAMQGGFMRNTVVAVAHTHRRRGCNIDVGGSGLDLQRVISGNESSCVFNLLVFEKTVRLIIKRDLNKETYATVCGCNRGSRSRYRRVWRLGFGLGFLGHVVGLAAFYTGSRAPTHQPQKAEATGVALFNAEQSVPSAGQARADLPPPDASIICHY